MLDVAYTLLAENADWVDRLALVAGAVELPRARERLDEQLDEPVGDEVADVIDLAAKLASFGARR